MVFSVVIRRIKMFWKKNSGEAISATPYPVLLSFNPQKESISYPASSRME